MESQAPELRKFVVIDEFSLLLSNLDVASMDRQQLLDATNNLRDVIADKLTQYIAGQDTEFDLSVEEIVSNPGACTRIVAAGHFFEACTSVYSNDTFLQIVNSEASDMYGGTDDAHGFARSLLISSSPELAGCAPAEFLREADEKDLTSVILPELLRNVATRLPHANLEVLWSKYSD